MLRVGPALHCRGGEVRFARYANGNVAIVIVGPNGEIESKVSVNMDETVPRKLKPNEVWLKGWAENEGIPAALYAAGVVRLTGEATPAGPFAYAQLAELTPAAMAVLIAQEAKPC